jgi:hypothetical protein
MTELYRAAYYRYILQTSERSCSSFVHELDNQKVFGGHLRMLGLVDLCFLLYAPESGGLKIREEEEGVGSREEGGGRMDE